MKIVNSAHDVKERIRETSIVDPFEAAVSQIHGLIVLHKDGFLVTPSIVLDAFDGLVQGDSGRRRLPQLLQLLRELQETKLFPYPRTMENLWFQSSMQAEEPQEFIEISTMVELLEVWITRDSVPMSVMEDLLERMIEKNIPMSHGVWNLFQNFTHSDEGVLEAMWKVLSYSDLDWAAQQCTILRQLECPTTRQALTTLQAAARSGLIADSAWVCRTLLPNNTQAQGLLLDSLYYSDLPRSLLYMERLLFGSKADTLLANQTIPVTPEFSKRLLQKCEHSRAGGMHTETVFRRLLQSTRADVMSGTIANATWHPDSACIACVVESYLQTPSLRNIHHADRFLRLCVQDYGMCGPNDVRLFEKLLVHYRSVRVNQTEAIVVSKSADGFFRFFLVQHRKQRVNESPKIMHLECVADTWRRVNSTRRTKEYVRLYETMFHRGMIDCNVAGHPLRALLL